MYPAYLNDYIILDDISPEGMYYSDYRARTKICHRFTHEKYNIPTLVLDGRKWSADEYVLPFLL